MFGCSKTRVGWIVVIWHHWRTEGFPVRRVEHRKCKIGQRHKRRNERMKEEVFTTKQCHVVRLSFFVRDEFYKKVWEEIDMSYLRKRMWCCTYHCYYDSCPIMLHFVVSCFGKIKKYLMRYKRERKKIISKKQVTNERNDKITWWCFHQKVSFHSMLLVFIRFLFSMYFQCYGKRQMKKRRNKKKKCDCKLR